jgi:hypothetical protein
MIKIALFRILVIGNYLGFGAWDLVLKAHISLPTLINANRALPLLIAPDPG